MRLIDADALIVKLQNCIKLNSIDQNDYSYGKISALNHAIVLAKKQTTVSGWISVKDRLPEKSGWYLVSLVNTRTGHRWEVPVSADYSHGKWDYAYLGEEDATWMLNNTVTHWMPIPEPPKEDDHG